MNSRINPDNLPGHVGRLAELDAPDGPALHGLADGTHLGAWGQLSFHPAHELCNLIIGVVRAHGEAEVVVGPCSSMVRGVDEETAGFFGVPKILLIGEKA